MERQIYMTFAEHVEALRWCLIKAAGAVLAGVCVSFFFGDRIFLFMVAPLKTALKPGQTLIGTGVTEAFFVEIKVALVAGTFLASPVVFYQIWRFVQPALHAAERKLVVPFVLAATFFFLGGAYFCYRFVLPAAFAYFIGQYSSLDVSPEIRIGEYFTFFFAWCWPLASPSSCPFSVFSW